jgi:lysophospholipase L1-like esterase
MQATIDTGEKNEARAPHAEAAVKRFLMLLGTGVLLVGVLALVLELGLRVYFTLRGDSTALIRYVMTREQINQLDPYAIPMPFLEYGLSPDFRDHNALGYRGAEVAIPKPEGTYRIVALGGSTTYGFTGSNITYPSALEETLRGRLPEMRIEVVNAGVASYTSFNTFSTFAYRVLELQPDLVIIYDNANDIFPRHVSPDCYRNLDQYLGLDPRTRLAVERQPELSGSTLYRFISISLGWQLDPSRLESFLVPVTRGCTQGGTPEQNVPQNPPIYFERNIRSMIGIAQAHDIDVMLATWAYQHASPLAFPWWQTAVEEHNDILRALAEEYDTHFIDYAPLAPQDAASWTDYVHMSEAGSRHQAAAFADVLIAEALP